jgi:uncharacterized SAM-binding protein YcdF (DUF218 family)
MSWGAAGLLENVIGPPGGLLLLFLLGLVFLVIRRRVGVLLIVSGTLLLYACSIPATATWLLGMLESPASITQQELAAPRAQAIVILGAGRREEAPEYHPSGAAGDTLNASALDRIRYGAWLARRTRLPVLVSGGLADEDGPAEAVMMQQALEQEFGVPVRWVESASRNTWENAQFSARLLQEQGIEAVYLVTHAYHMPRAVWCFERVALDVHPAPTGYLGSRRFDAKLEDFLPSAGALSRVATVFHEQVGRLWYWLRF